MEYNIFSNLPPTRPKPGKGTEVIGLVASQVSLEMRDAMPPMVFPAFASRVTDVKFQFSSNEYKELHGQISQLIGHSGVGKDQLNRLTEVICAPLRAHDEIEMQKIAQWQALPKKEREKKTRPTVALYFPPGDITKPAFIQNAVACENDGGHAQFLNLPEVEMLDGLGGGKKAAGQMLINIHDVKRDGALRATAEGVTGNPVMRADICISSTEEAARDYYKRDIRKGKLGRVCFAYKPRGKRVGKIPRVGSFDDAFLTRLEVYLERLDKAKGTFVVKPLNKIADQLATEMADVADFADDDTLFELSHRCITAAWKKGALLWLMNDQVWTRSIGEYVIWFCYFDLWSKVHVVGDMFKPGITAEEVRRSGPKNMLNDLGDSFSETDLEALRAKMDKSIGGDTKHQLHVWKDRGFITYSDQTGLYTKTELFLNRKKK